MSMSLKNVWEQILGGMEGITSVDVMITLSATSEKVLEKSIQLEENKAGDRKRKWRIVRKKCNKQS